MNLLKRKLVAHPKDWPWSSFSIPCNPEARFGGHRSGQLIHSRMAPTKPPSFPLRRTGPLKIQIKGRTTRPLGRISFSLSGFVFLSLVEVKSRQAEDYPTMGAIFQPAALSQMKQPPTFFCQALSSCGCVSERASPAHGPQPICAEVLFRMLLWEQAVRPWAGGLLRWSEFPE